MSDSKPGRILVVDDSDETRLLLKFKIGACFPASSIFEATSGQEAIDSLKQNKFDLVICDYLMPEKSGLEIFFFLEHLKNRPHFVMFTADSNMVSSPAWSEVFVIIEKPEFDELVHQIQMFDFRPEVES